MRVGDTVRKPWLAGTPAVHAYLALLAERDPELPLPRALGRDAAGRQVLDFVPGALALDLPPFDSARLHAIGALIRRIHDASPSPGEWMSAARPPFAEPLLPAPSAASATGEPDVIGHHDLAPWNLVIEGDAETDAVPPTAMPRLTFIDWDGAGPTTRAWELAYALPAFAFAHADADPREIAERMRALWRGYVADPLTPADLADLRGRTLALLAPRAAAMHDHLRDTHVAGVEPWATMFTAGHGAHWRGVADFLAAHHGEWMRALA
ncbi:phosphotransferase [Schumannella soli]|uniref:Phosphotransferase n=1 Tax=Schumannella soli TaxID=2590779 RepID=A0A506Y8I4_9MICO|nr:phosphotransferase [Schumannella soli]